MINLAKKKDGVPLGSTVIEVSAEWNHSCTSQCSNPCTVNRLAQPGPRMRGGTPTLDSF